MGQARAIARLEGFPDIAMAEYPGHPAADDAEVTRAKLIDGVIPAIVAALSGPDYE